MPTSMPPGKQRKRLSARRAGAALSLLCLCPLLCMSSLSGCTTARTQYVPVTRVVTPPAALYSPKPLPPPPELMTCQALARWVTELLVWCGEAGADRAAQRKWAAAMENEVKANKP